MLNQTYEQYCGNRLPCGICRLTNSQCPKMFWPITVTCNPCGDAVPTTSATTTASTTYTTSNNTVLDHIINCGKGVKNDA